MAKELIVSVNGREKKIAIIENDQVTEFYIERGEENQGIVGNIYKGRVMRVLPGMQSAFVDVGLERDAFLYVSDFFDEEEEFERIVIDKAKQGEPNAGLAAAEQIALGRVEREHRIEATQERVEPLREAEQGPTAEVPPAETAEAARRRSRHGGRRRGGRKDAPVDTAAPSRTDSVVEADENEVQTPLVMRDPSIQRIIDDEETAANGEMFKDARLQERILDQIHAVEFNLEDDFRTAEVGSILPVSGYRDGSFQRVDDGDEESDTPQITMRSPLPVASRVNTFVDSVAQDTLNSGSFQRISDDEETPQMLASIGGDVEVDEDEEEVPEKHGFVAQAVEKIVSLFLGHRRRTQAIRRSGGHRVGTDHRAQASRGWRRRTGRSDPVALQTVLLHGPTAPRAHRGDPGQPVGVQRALQSASHRLLVRRGRRRRCPFGLRGLPAGELAVQHERRADSDLPDDPWRPPRAREHHVAVSPRADHQHPTRPFVRAQRSSSSYMSPPSWRVKTCTYNNLERSTVRSLTWS